jgi:hypothetical protein
MLMCSLPSARQHIHTATKALCAHTRTHKRKYTHNARCLSRDTRRGTVIVKERVVVARAVVGVVRTLCEIALARG